MSKAIFSNYEVLLIFSFSHFFECISYKFISAASTMCFIQVLEMTSKRVVFTPGGIRKGMTYYPNNYFYLLFLSYQLCLLLISFAHVVAVVVVVVTIIIDSRRIILN